MSGTNLAAPTYEQVQHWLRDLGWDERFTGVQMTPSAGNKVHDMYNFAAALRFVFGTDWEAPLLDEDHKGSINWADMDKFIDWVRSVIGDVELADAMDAVSVEEEFLMAKIKATEPIVVARAEQYRAVRDAAEGVATIAAPEAAVER